MGLKFHQPSFLELNLPSRFGDWLAGFTDGEGSFMLYCLTSGNERRANMAFSISLRDDDLETLRYIQETLKIGRVERHKRPTPLRGNEKPIAKYTVRRKSDLKHVIVPIFEQHRLLSKKKRDFEVWRRAVEISICLRIGHKIPDHLWVQLQGLQAELREIRIYKAPLALLETG